VGMGVIEGYEPYMGLVGGSVKEEKFGTERK
jgi:hypothetical protein